MAEQTTVNPVLQIMAAVRAQQSSASPTGRAEAAPADDAASSFSQALKSANARINDGASAQDTAPAAKSSQTSPADEPADNGATPPVVDTASQAMAALLALQASLSKPADTQPALQTSGTRTTPEDPIVAAATKFQSLIPKTKDAVELATPKTETAVAAASLAAKNMPASTSTDAALTDLQAQSKSVADESTVFAQAGTKDQSASKEDLLNQSKEQFAGQSKAIDSALTQLRETSNKSDTVTPNNSFAAELGNAQAAFGIKTETRIESQASAPTYTVNAPVNSSAWAEELGTRVHWVATKDSGRAELVLNPAHMGKIEVSINLNGDQASASFTAANSATREALQDALPRLREVLADAGIQLGQTSVNAGNSGQAQADQNAANSSSRSWNPAASATSGTEVIGDPIEKRIQRSNGLVDLFA